MTQNINATRIVDPILSAVVQGYTDAEFVGLELFPRVPVQVRGGTTIEFGKESFKAYNLRRAPGAESKRMTFGYSGKKFSLVEDSLEALVPREQMQDAAAVPNINLATRAVSNVSKVILRSLELEQAGIARNPANYEAENKVSVVAADKWNNPSADVIGQVMAAREVIRSKIGAYPNKMVISAKVFAGLKENTGILDRIKYTQTGLVTAGLLAALFEIDTVVVAKAIYADETTDNFIDIWGTDVIMAYVPTAIAGQEQPSYGYTYTLEGSPLVEAPYYDNARKAWVYGVSHEHAPVLTAMGAGFLFQNAA